MYTPHASTRGTSRRRPGGKAKSPQAVLVVRGPLVLATSRAKRMMLRRANLERPKQGALVNTVQALALANNLHLAERAGRVFSGLSAAQPGNFQNRGRKHRQWALTAVSDPGKSALRMLGVPAFSVLLSKTRQNQPLAWLSSAPPSVVSGVEGDPSEWFASDDTFSRRWLLRFGECLDGNHPPTKHWSFAEPVEGTVPGDSVAWLVCAPMGKV
eukprot:CAMPEP_0194511036 /NCGR_PEP_ID=MMETSP0253-20130528/42575_1 /TAXON_ID=2966 /ORGANISM="Noctiluca scintillans" /LENGTH=212 /DNA_ID=CAMNT_0039354335 /DNA_START=110 /DNA_END=749 /DNA_ORIENTATION=+